MSKGHGANYYDTLLQYILHVNIGLNTYNITPSVLLYMLYGARDLTILKEKLDFDLILLR
jgi:hypothetical protein